MRAGSAEPVPWADLVNVIKAFVGSNYMGAPFAMRMAGLGLGVPGFLVLAVVTAVCCNALVQAKNEVQVSRIRLIYR